MLTKEKIQKIKAQGSLALSSLIKSLNSETNLLFVLNNLGRLPQNFDASCLKVFLSSKNDKVRLSVVKNLGKIKNDSNLEIFYHIACNDSSIHVRRESVSSIGRMRSPKIIQYLLKLLEHHDPSVIGQAIRGLLIFKGKKEVDQQLKKQIKHENEMIQQVIQKEYFNEQHNSKDKLKHKECYDYLKNTVVLGDVIEVLQQIPKESFHLTFTSPPYYNAKDYSIYSSYKSYLYFLEEVFHLIFDKTKEGRFLIINSSPIIIPRISRQYSSKRYPIPFDIHSFLTQIGWEFIDDILWVKPEASVKNRNAGFLQHRKPLAYKPNNRTEYLMVYRKKTNRLIDWNLRQYDFQTIEESKIKDGYETSNLWEIDPTFDKIHSAVFPVELCKRIIEYYSFKNDLVFDPFAGSGTLGKTAQLLDRYFFLTEKEKKYFDYMKKSLLTKENDNLFQKRKIKFLDFKDFKTKII